MKGPPESPFNEHVIALAEPEIKFWAVNRLHVDYLINSSAWPTWRSTRLLPESRHVYYGCSASGTRKINHIARMLPFTGANECAPLYEVR